MQRKIDAQKESSREAGSREAGSPKIRLPLVLSTPQKLYWEGPAGEWNHFAEVDITFTVQRNDNDELEAVTTNNGEPFTQTFIGPDPDEES